MRNGYNGWGFYSNPRDPRLIVPKMNPIMGWTVNLAHREVRVALVLMAVLIAAGMAASILAR
jgi:uncharacterized membrane protein